MVEYSSVSSRVLPHPERMIIIAVICDGHETKIGDTICNI